MKNLTTAGKIVLLVFAALLLGGVGFFLGWFDNLSFVGQGRVNVGSQQGQPLVSSDTMEVSLNEWVGFKPFIDANGGLTTQPGSIYDQLGLKVNFKVINDASVSSTSLISGNLVGAGYTINRYSFLYPKFVDSNIQVKCVMLIDRSNGGDGIICKQGINRIEDLLGKTIGVPRYGEGQTLVEWLVAKSSLSDAQIKQLRRNFKYFNTVEDATKAFFGGQLDAVATFQPYLGQATQTTGAKVLFDTKAATNLIVDGMIFRADYIAKYPDRVAKFIEGAIKAESMYTTNLNYIKDAMPMFATMTDSDIVGMAGDALMTDYSTNVKLSRGTIQVLFRDMSDVWKALGNVNGNERAMPQAYNDAFDFGPLNTLAGKFPLTEVSDPKFTEAQRQSAQQMSNDKAIITNHLAINFESGSATIKKDSASILSEFANTVKIMDGAIIQLEGNTDDVGDAAMNKSLSQARAKAVASFLQWSCGLNPTRFVVIGNGEACPDGSSEDTRANARRTDVYLKIPQ